MKQESQDERLVNLRKFLSHVSFSIFGQVIFLTSDIDKKYHNRIYLQAFYNDGRGNALKGRKDYLSDHMTEDEIIKRAYSIFKDFVEHEVMRGFKFYDVNTKKNIIVFNPKVDFRKLLEASPHEVDREYTPPFDF